jgi:glycolate oxidase iron-sulfur subunit
MRTRAAAAIEACVHCGFCLATCPTYLDTRDERDSPRGRIYLVKELLETGVANRLPSSSRPLPDLPRAARPPAQGVRYGEIVDRVAQLLERELPRSFGSALQRACCEKSCPTRSALPPLLRIGQLLRPLLPAALREHVPPRQAAAARRHQPAACAGAA